jgi:hypothetical protein
MKKKKKKEVVTSPSVQFVLFKFVHVNEGRLVVHLKDADKVGDGQHTDKLLPLAVPERCRSNSCQITQQS